MKLQEKAVGDSLIVTVEEGRIDAAIAIQFKDRMRALSTAGVTRVILNLEQVDFMDSSGLGAVVATMKHVNATSKLELAALTPTVAKVFQLTRMDRVFTIHPAVDDALETASSAA